jgi:3,2-trans-enoyl-CoA isomerase
MNTIKVSVRDKIAFLSLDNGKSNAINAEMLNELSDTIKAIDQDSGTGGLIITGKENFFSAGLDLIELYDYDAAQISKFWTNFLELVYVFSSLRKPAIAAINGHSPAGGCVLALCCDYRVMAEGKFIIGLNEIPVGLIVPESIFQLYAFWLGKGNAYRFLLEGKLMSSEEAIKVGLVDEVCNQQSIVTVAERQMKKYIQLGWTTWQQSKMNLRRELIGHLKADQTETLKIMLEQWWSPSTRKILQTIISNLQNKPRNV